MYDNIAIIGYSGHAYVVIDTIRRAGRKVSFYCDKTTVRQNPFQLEYLGFEGDYNFSGWRKEIDFLLGVGDNAIRHKIGLTVLKHNKQLLTPIHPTAVISEKAEIGLGTFIAAQATVNALARVGRFVILNTGCIVEHECQIADGVHIAPGAVLAGNVSVGENSFVGANAVVKQGVKIGKNVVVGAGTVILKNVEDNQTIVGNPGREI